MVEAELIACAYSCHQCRLGIGGFGEFGENVSTQRNAIRERLADLKLQIDVFRHFLTVRLEQFDCFFQRLKHLVSGGLPVFHSHHVTHYFHQTRIVTFLDRLVQSGICRFNEVIQIL